MSSDLCWREAPKPAPEVLGSAGVPLKSVIVYWVFGDYAEATNLYGNPVVIDVEHEDAALMTYLRGYLDAREDEEIREFYEDLKTHKRLEVWIES